MRPILITPLEIAQRYIGLAEIEGGKSHPFISWCFSLCAMNLDTPDETPWCSAFAQHPAWELRLPRSKSARARSWLLVGDPIPVSAAEPGADVVIFARGQGRQPGPDVIDAPGHVAYFAGIEGDSILAVGGNQGNAVSLMRFPIRSVLGVRRLA
jgi:uncharacterized protein (TIGR02594 family)